MKKILKIFFLLFIISLTTYGKNNSDNKKFLESFIKVGIKYSIDPKILVSIAYYESGFNKDVISVNCHKKNNKKKLISFLKNLHYPYKIFSNRVNIFLNIVKDQYKIILFNYLEKEKFNYDIGLMQINSYNIKTMKLNKIKLLEDIKYNIEIGAIILKKCFNKFPDKINYAFECYNKGYNFNKFNDSYYNNIALTFAKLFYKK